MPGAATVTWHGDFHLPLRGGGCLDGMSLLPGRSTGAKPPASPGRAVVAANVETLHYVEIKHALRVQSFRVVRMFHASAAVAEAACREICGMSLNDAARRAAGSPAKISRSDE